MNASARLGRASLPSALALLVLLISVFLSSVASAHPAPSSVAFIDFTVAGALVEQDVPIEELERAMHLRLLQPGESAETAGIRQASLLSEYAARHLRATSQGAATPWVTRVTSVTGHASSDGPRIRFRLELQAPGDASGSVQLHDDIVTHEVVSHYTMVYVRSDWSAGAVEADPQLAGTIHAGHNDILVARRGSFWHGLRSVVALGARHIASGSDHLVFLFTLVLVAPLAFVRRGWQGRRCRRETLLQLAGVVSAFTVGHSLTLALGAVGWVALPATLVEVAIALSILVTAIHAIRPIFPRREALVAAAFGLIHGLGFASTLSGRNLSGAQTVWTLLGFNVGIELAQLGLLALVVPWLLLLARTRAYEPFRVLGGGSAATLALGWMVERIANVPSPTALPLAWLEQHPLHLLFGLALLAIFANVGARAAPEPSGA